MAQVRRASPLMPAFVLGACAMFLAHFLSNSNGSESFLTASPRGRRTAMRGFKEDFADWKSSLSSDEKSLLLKQAQNEFNKKFRKSEDMSKDLPEEKIESFSKILQKFFDSEMEDYKKDAGAKTPDYDSLQRKAALKVYDFSLKQRIVEVDRDADRRYQFASDKIAAAEAEGKLYPRSSPMREIWAVQNNDTESHDRAQSVMDFIKSASEQADAPKDAKPYIDELLEAGVPPVGEEFELVLPQVPVSLLHRAQGILSEYMAKMKESASEEEYNKFAEEKLPEVWAKAINHIVTRYLDARDEIEEEVKNLKTFFGSQKKEMPGKTKADILKEIWAELPKHTDKPVPALDEEMLAELAAEPAVIEEEKAALNWGTADKLYKSEAIDSFGQKYLLGVFETQEEASKAFDAWNVEYEKAREDMKDEVQQWGKQEQARMDADSASQERIQKALEEARR